jgi:hypothetical protein
MKHLLALIAALCAALAVAAEDDAYWIGEAQKHTVSVAQSDHMMAFVIATGEKKPSINDKGFAGFYMINLQKDDQKGKPMGSGYLMIVIADCNTHRIKSSALAYFPKLGAEPRQMRTLDQSATEMSTLPFETVPSDSLFAHSMNYVCTLLMKR